MRKTRLNLASAVGVLVCVFAAGLAWAQQPQPVANAGPGANAPSGRLFHTKSEFNTISVFERDGRRWLEFEDGATQSEMDVNHPERLTLAYARAIMSGFAVTPRPQRILIVGLGGGSMPMFIRRAYPELQIDVAELDPVVADVARKYFSFKEDERLKVYIGDGRKLIETTQNRYDIIFLDAYGADSIPFSLATRQFIAAVKSKLTEDGIAVSNVWSFSSNKLYHSMVKTYLDVFPEMHVIRAKNSSNRIFIAPNKKMELNRDKLVAGAKALTEKPFRPLKLAELIQGEYEEIRVPADAKVLLDGQEPKP